MSGSFLSVCIDEFAKTPAPRARVAEGLNRVLDMFYGQERAISAETIRFIFSLGLTNEQILELAQHLERDYIASRQREVVAPLAPAAPPQLYARAPRTKRYGPHQDADLWFSPEKLRAYNYAATFVVTSPVARLPDREWWPLVRQVFRRDGYVCTYCGAHGDEYILHCDHIVPVIKGGPNVEENLTTACEHCNTSKRDALPHEWRPLQAVPQTGEGL